MDVPGLAAEMVTACLIDGQAARRVASDEEAERVRGELRRLARRDDVRIRTARLGDAVVVARADAALWSDDAATMRRKLSPPD